jgi:hypothetical protein
MKLFILLLLVSFGLSAQPTPSIAELTAVKWFYEGYDVNEKNLICGNRKVAGTPFEGKVKEPIPMPFTDVVCSLGPGEKDKKTLSIKRVLVCQNILKPKRDILSISLDCGPKDKEKTGTGVISGKLCDSNKRCSVQKLKILLICKT